MSIYLAVDLKSFYASVECVERNLNPLTTNLVVADKSRTEKTICLAVTPSLKAYKISGRARLFEVVQRVREINSIRARHAPYGVFRGRSANDSEVSADNSLALDYIVAPPRMQLYEDYSARILQVYQKYIAPEDIDVYSIDEVFMDITTYLKTYGMSPQELAMTIIRDILRTTGITATAGIGTNLYLAKIAMDIVAKHKDADENGVRLAQLDEISYRKQLWEHKPITDFWRVGPGYANRLAAVGLYTMGDVARCLLGRSGEYYSQDLLYGLFGINAELLIDHAWGYESTTLADIRALRSKRKSLGQGQVLQCPYPYEKARLVTHEMAESLSLDLVRKELLTIQLVLTVGYDTSNLQDRNVAASYEGETSLSYGKKIPVHAHGTVNLDFFTSSTVEITKAATELFDRIVNPRFTVRRINIAATALLSESDAKDKVRAGYAEPVQTDLFTDYEALEKQKQKQEQARKLDKEHKLQLAMLKIKDKFGKNAVVKAVDLQEGATAMQRNGQIGGHKA